MSKRVVEVSYGDEVRVHAPDDTGLMWIETYTVTGDRASFFVDPKTARDLANAITIESAR